MARHSGLSTVDGSPDLAAVPARPHLADTFTLSTDPLFSVDARSRRSRPWPWTRLSQCWRRTLHRLLSAGGLTGSLSYFGGQRERELRSCAWARQVGLRADQLARGQVLAVSSGEDGSC
ncbi:hypothetical protein GCM10010129_71780 [Streptomyces fumigatiscleroticus]|nr:hypothetical protein GCM10010129_71780 [Streptomyces fumigatiscleroticus]